MVYRKVKFFIIFVIILYPLGLLSAQETATIETTKEFEFYKEKIIDLEKRISELTKMLTEQNELLQSTKENSALLEGALNDLSLERKEEEKKLSQIEKYLQEEKSILTKINELLNDQGNKQTELTKETDNLKEKIKKSEENLLTLSKEINELKTRKIEIPVQERKLRAKNPQVDRYLKYLESPWVPPIALGIAIFTFLLIVF